MNIYSPFNIEVAAGKRTFGPHPASEGTSNGDAAGVSAGQSVGAFITVQSLVSFTGATGAISLLWSTIKSLGIVPASLDVYVGFALSVLIAVLIYYINISDPKARNTRQDKIIGFIIALLNSLVLFGATKSIVGSA